MIRTMEETWTLVGQSPISGVEDDHHSLKTAPSEADSATDCDNADKSKFDPQPAQVVNFPLIEIKPEVNEDSDIQAQCNSSSRSEMEVNEPLGNYPQDGGNIEVVIKKEVSDFDQADELPEQPPGPEPTANIMDAAAVEVKPVVIGDMTVNVAVKYEPAYDGMDTNQHDILADGSANRPNVENIDHVDYQAYLREMNNATAACSKVASRIIEKQKKKRGKIVPIAGKLKVLKKGIRTGPKQYFCRKCRKILPSRIAMETHMLYHKKSRPWECRLCGLRFLDLILHNRRHFSTNTYPCSVCGFVSTTERAFRCHVSTSHKELGLKKKKSQFACPYCSKKYAMLKSLEKHMEQHGNFTCSECGMNYNLKSSFDSHSCKGREEKPLVCQVCEIVFKNRHQLECHMSLHGGDITHFCDRCSEGFTCLHYLREHFKEAHPGQPCYACSQCSRMFHTRRQVKKHMKGHSAHLPYPCNVCQLRFKDQMMAYKHMRTHDPTAYPAPYQCTECGEGFDLNRQLKTHVNEMHKPPTITKASAEASTDASTETSTKAGSEASTANEQLHAAAEKNESTTVSKRKKKVYHSLRQELKALLDTRHNFMMAVPEKWPSVSYKTDNHVGAEKERTRHRPRPTDNTALQKEMTTLFDKKINSSVFAEQAASTKKLPDDQSEGYKPKHSGTAESLTGVSSVIYRAKPVLQAESSRSSVSGGVSAQGQFHTQHNYSTASAGYEQFPNHDYSAAFAGYGQFPRLDYSPAFGDCGQFPRNVHSAALAGYGQFPRNVHSAALAGYGQFPRNVHSAALAGYGQFPRNVHSTAFGGYEQLARHAYSTAFGGYGQFPRRDYTAAFGQFPRHVHSTAFSGGEEYPGHDYSAALAGYGQFPRPDYSTAFAGAEHGEQLPGYHTADNSGTTGTSVSEDNLSQEEMGNHFEGKHDSAISMISQESEGSADESADESDQLPTSEFLFKEIAAQFEKNQDF